MPLCGRSCSQQYRKGYSAWEPQPGSHATAPGQRVEVCGARLKYSQQVGNLTMVVGIMFVTISGNSNAGAEEDVWPLRAPYPRNVVCASGWRRAPQSHYEGARWDRHHSASWLYVGTSDEDDTSSRWSSSERQSARPIQHSYCCRCRHAEGGTCVARIVRSTCQPIAFI